MAFLEVRELSVFYQSGAARQQAVDRISFDVPLGARAILMGRSGCGKSTILKAVGGFLDGFEGSIAIDGKTVRKPGPDRMVVWQDHEQLLPWKTVLANVAYPLEMSGARDARAQARAWLEKVGLARALDLYPHQLSGGMKMRAAIARGFALQPKALLMDEPFSSLDAHTRETVQDLLVQLQEETKLSLLFVTHDLSEALRLGQQIIVLSSHPGRVLKHFRDTRGDLSAEIRALLAQEGHA